MASSVGYRASRAQWNGGPIPTPEQALAEWDPALWPEDVMMRETANGPRGSSHARITSGTRSSTSQAYCTSRNDARNRSTTSGRACRSHELLAKAFNLTRVKHWCGSTCQEA